MPSKEVVRCFRCSNEVRDFVLGEVGRLFNEDASMLLGSLNIVICSGMFDEVYAVNNALHRVFNDLVRGGRYPYSVGLYVGRLRRLRPHFIPSVMLAEFIYGKLRYFVNAVKVSLNGLKPFLYGNDILKESVTNYFPKVVRGRVTFVIGPDNYVYGLGISTVNDYEIKGLKPTDVVVKNVFDVGWYVRGGTEVREKKFKV